MEVGDGIGLHLESNWVDCDGLSRCLRLVVAYHRHHKGNEGAYVSGEAVDAGFYVLHASFECIILLLECILVFLLSGGVLLFCVFEALEDVGEWVAWGGIALVGTRA